MQFGKKFNFNSLKKMHIAKMQCKWQSQTFIPFKHCSLHSAMEIAISIEVNLCKFFSRVLQQYCFTVQFNVALFLHLFKIFSAVRLLLRQKDSGKSFSNSSNQGSRERKLRKAIKCKRNTLRQTSNLSRTRVDSLCSKESQG